MLATTSVACRGQAVIGAQPFSNLILSLNASRPQDGFCTRELVSRERTPTGIAIK